MSHFDYDGAKASIDHFLQLLGTDYIDMMLLHQPFGDSVKITEIDYLPTRRLLRNA